MKAVRVWNTRNVAGGPNGPSKFGLQAAIYERIERADGIPVWRLVEGVGDMQPISDIGRTRAEAAGGKTGLPREYRARNGGLAYQVSDLLEPADESALRLDGLTLAFAFAKNKAKFSVALVAWDNIKWRIRRRFPAMSRRQAEDVMAVLAPFGVSFFEVDSLPRKEGAPIDVSRRS